jgi:hypothetical protein
MPEGARMIWQEFGPMRFRRSLRFGAPVDPNRVEATYRNGLLLINMPKSEEAKPRQVRVQVAEPHPETRQEAAQNNPQGTPSSCVARDAAGAGSADCYG